MFKAKNKRTTNSMKLKFARLIKRRKGSKFTTKVLTKIQMSQSGVTMVLYLTSKDFTLGPFIRGKIRRVLHKTRTVPFIRACLIS